MDQFDPWQVVLRQVFTPYSCGLILTAFVVVSHTGCLGVSSVTTAKTGSTDQTAKNCRLIRVAVFR